MSELKATALYVEHFGLSEAPFKITPTTEFFYGGGQRGEILHALLYAISVGEGIMAVTGEVGSGKTMLLRTLIEKLPDNIDIIYIANPSLSGREILYNICEELGMQASENRPDTVRMLQNYLVEQHTKKRRVIAFIDEAQAMPDESLEEVRLLSNLETSRDKLMQIVLFGQPEFEEKLKQQNMRQLRERITVSLKLKPFGRNDIREYIATRLRAAGYNGAPLFSNEACRLIAIISQGLSRRINVLADKAMLSAYENTSLTVSAADARRAIRDVNFGKMRYRSEQSKRFSKHLTIGIAAASLLLLGVAASVRLYGGNIDQPENIVAADNTVEPAPSSSSDNATALIAAADSSTADDVQAVIADEQPVVTIEQPVVTITATAPEVVVQTVTQIVAQQEEGNDRQAMLAAISEVSRSEGEFSGDWLAQQIADNAEIHGNVPQTQGGQSDWQETQVTAPSVKDNERWHWMPASSYLRSRLNATQTWMQTGINTRSYTARLITVDQQRGVFLEKFLRYFSDFYPIRNVMVYPLDLSQGKKFVVTFGVYSARSDAEVFIKNVPYYFTGGKPFAQQLSVSLAESQRAWNSE